MADPKLTYGVKNLYYAMIIVGSDGTISYSTPIAIPGAKSISLPPIGDTVKVYADDIVYYTLLVNQGYDGTITIMGVPESFELSALGFEKSTEGMIVEKQSGKLAPFALMWEFQTDVAGKAKRGVLYNCTAGRVDIAGDTQEETVEPGTTALPITASPREDGLIKSSLIADSTSEKWANWFKTVPLPTFEIPAP